MDSYKKFSGLVLVLALLAAGSVSAGRDNRFGRGSTETEGESDEQMSSVALFGDSEIAGGNIGRGLSCLATKNTIAYGNATASNYVRAVSKCRLLGSYQPALDDNHKSLCEASAARFESVLNDDKIDTVVVALGDNPNRVRDFETMLNDIREKHKKCIWIAPAEKEPELTSNRTRDLALKTLEEKARLQCQIYDPSADGERFQAFKGHYPKKVGWSLGRKICKELRKIEAKKDDPEWKGWTDAPTPPKRPVDLAPVIQ